MKKYHWVGEWVVKSFFGFHEEVKNKFSNQSKMLFITDEC